MNDLEGGLGLVDPRGPNRIPLLVTAVAIFVVIVVGSWSVFAYSGLQRSYHDLESSYSRDKEAIMDHDADLLLSVMNKLADVSQDKETKTGLAEFGVIRDAFRLLGAGSGIPQQNYTLCGNPAVTAAFAVNASVDARHTKTCVAYARVVPLAGRVASGGIGIGDYQSTFNDLIMALIELDNAISSDP